jgi:hypothetical protein
MGVWVCGRARVWEKGGVGEGGWALSVVSVGDRTDCSLPPGSPLYIPGVTSTSAGSRDLGSPNCTGGAEGHASQDRSVIVEVPRENRRGASYPRTPGVDATWGSSRSVEMPSWRGPVGTHREPVWSSRDGSSSSADGDRFRAEPPRTSSVDRSARGPGRPADGETRVPNKKAAPPVGEAPLKRPECGSGGHPKGTSSLRSGRYFTTVIRCVPVTPSPSRRRK